MKLPSRHQAYAYEVGSVSHTVVSTLVKQSMARMPSKQQRVRYRAVLIDTSVDDWSNLLYNSTLSPDSEYGYNPQILAPYVLAMGPRDSAWDADDVDYDQFCKEASLEIGLVAGHLTLLAPTLELATSFTGCISDRDEIEAKLGFSPEVLVSIGIERNGDSYMCPIRGVESPLPEPSNRREYRPGINTYYTEITS